MAVPSYVPPTSGFSGVRRPPTPYGGITVDASGRQNLNKGGNTNQQATEGAKQFKSALGLPSYEDILGKLGGGQGTREFGNASRAGEGADYFQQQMRDQMGNINRARQGVRNPTGTSGFKTVMQLTDQRLGNEAENDRRQAAEAASRRGYVGGYSGEQGDLERKSAYATAGNEAALAEREAQQKLFEGETGLYGTEAAGFTDLTKTAAELPTKYLDAYSNLLGGLSSGFGDIFGTASRNVQFDTGNTREDDARRANDARARNAQARSSANVGYA